MSCAADRQLLFMLNFWARLSSFWVQFRCLCKIQRIHLRCGSIGSAIRFWILVRKRNIRFRIKNPDLDFSKETHPWMLIFMVTMIIMDDDDDVDDDDDDDNDDYDHDDGGATGNEDPSRPS